MQKILTSGWEVKNNRYHLEKLRAYTKAEDVVYAEGKATISPTEGLIVGQTYNFKISFTAAGTGINQNGGVRFALPASWSIPQTKHAWWEGYVTVVVPKTVRAKIEISACMPLEWYITVLIKEGTLKAGERLELNLHRMRIQRFPQDTWKNWRNHLGVFVDQQGNGDYNPLKETDRYPYLQIVADKPARIRVILPARARVLEEVKLKISILDRFQNKASVPWQGKLFIRSEPFCKSVPKEVIFTKENNNVQHIPIKFDHEGIFQIEVVSEDGQLKGVSNCIECSLDEPRYRIYFGDIHAKTGVSDGLGSPDEFYEHARWIAGSDFSAIADHNHRECGSVEKPWQVKMSDEQWQTIQDAGQRWNKPGEFVTLIAVEEPMAQEAIGHRNIYYLHPGQPLFKGKTIKELWKFLEGKEALVVPHHTLHLCKWVDHNPHFVKLIEIYSMWGSSESRGNEYWSKEEDKGLSVQEILDTGARLGFIASSDNHHGCPDVSAVPSRFVNMHYSGGVAAVLAKELTREAIYSALKNRKCYATTGERIILDFKINYGLMGDEIVIPSGMERRIKVKVIGTDDLRCIEVVKNNQVLARHEARGIREELVWTDVQAERECDFYYVRVRQANGAMAWSSPIWVSTHPKGF